MKLFIKKLIKYLLTQLFLLSLPKFRSKYVLNGDKMKYILVDRFGEVDKRFLKQEEFLEFIYRNVGIRRYFCFDEDKEVIIFLNSYCRNIKQVYFMYNDELYQTI